MATNLALLAGLMLTAALPPFPPTVVLAPLALILFFQALLVSDRPGRTGWVFGLAHQASLLHWLFFLDPSKSIPSRALVPVQAVAAICYVALFYLALGWVFGFLRRRLGEAMACWLLPVLWVGTEVSRGVGELGFPWCLSGVALAGSPLMRLYRSAGEAGLGLGLALLAVTVLCRRRSRSDSGTCPGPGRLLMGAGTLVWWLFLAVGSLPSGTVPGEAGVAGTVIKAAAVQPDVALADKWARGKIDSTRVPLTGLTAAAASAGARFVVWPETAVPAYLRYDRELLDWVRETARNNRIFLFTGFPDARRDPDGKVLTFNSSGLFDPRGNLVAQYAKYHLLPIGEVIPFEKYLPFLAGIDLGQAEWSPGRPPEPLTVDDAQAGFRFSCLICFESAFGRLARVAVRRGSRCLVIITNDGWFGRSAGPVQHAMLARVRAAECAVPVIRCANNGISLICDAEGRVLDELPLGVRGFARADVAPGGGDTLYVRAGLWPVWLFLLLWTGLGAWTVARHRKGKS